MSVSIDQQFVEFVVKALVSNPDAVSVNRTIDEKGVLLELTVDPEDLGRVMVSVELRSIRTYQEPLVQKRSSLQFEDRRHCGGGATQSRPYDDNRSQSDDTTAVDEPADKSVEEPTPEAVENTPSEYEEKHRKDLADLDDLDI
jgi:hypothetical protein